MSDVTMTDRDFKKVEAAIRQDERQRWLAAIDHMVSSPIRGRTDAEHEQQWGYLKALSQLKARMTGETEGML